MFTMPEKCPYAEFCWSIFSRIRTEYREILCISPYSVQLWEIRTIKTPNTDTFEAVLGVIDDTHIARV